MIVLDRFRRWLLWRRIKRRQRECPRAAQHGTEFLRSGRDRFGSYTFRKCGQCGHIADYQYTPNAERARWVKSLMI